MMHDARAFLLGKTAEMAKTDEKKQKQTQTHGIAQNAQNTRIYINKHAEIRPHARVSHANVGPAATTPEA